MTDSSQFDDKEKLNVLLKSAFEVTSTNESTPWYNEITVPFNNYVEGNTILIDDIPSNPNFNTIGNPGDYGLNYSDFYGGNDSNNSFGDGNIEIDSTGVLVKFKKLILEPTGNHNRSYYKMGTINGVSVNLLADSFQFTKNAIGQSKPFEYILHKNDNTGTNKISKDATGGNYFFDFKSGIIFFPDYNLVQSFVDENKPPLFTFVRYIGKKGVANLTSDSVKEDTTTIGTTIPAGTKIVISKSDLSNIKKQIIGDNQVYKLGNNSGLPNSEIAIESQNRETFSDTNGVGIKGYAHVHFNPHIKINNSSQTFTVKITINVTNYDSNDSRKLYAGTQGRTLLQDYVGSTEHLEVDDRNTFNYNLASGAIPTGQASYTSIVGGFNPSAPDSGINTKFDPGSEMITIVFLPNHYLAPYNQITYIESIEIESNQDMVTLPRNVGSYGINNDLIFNLENLDGTYREAMRLNQNQNLQVNGNLLANRLLIGGNNTADASYIPTVIGFSHNVTGDYSTAIGYNCSISDSYSMAVGYINNISNIYGYCFGRQNTITGSYSGCFGRLNEISNTYGFSTGYNNNNSGYGSIAMGLDQTVTGSYSAVIGRYNESGDNYSFTAGYQNTNNGYMSVAMSRENTITGDYAVVMGYNNSVSNHYSVSFGQNNETTHQFTLSQGYNNKIYGNYTTALGNNNSSNQPFCFMSGQYLRLNTNDYASSFGRYNIDSADLIFSIGNGTSTSARNNAFSVADSGNVGIGTSSPQHKLEISDGLNYPYSSSVHDSGPNELALLNINTSSWANAIKIVGSHSHSVGVYDLYNTQSSSWTGNSRTDGATFNRWAHFSKYGDLYFRYYYDSGNTNNNRNVLILKHDGKVGIGKTPQYYELEVDGHMEATGSISSGNDMISGRNLIVLGEMYGCNIRGMSAYASSSSDYKTITTDGYYRILKSASTSQRICFRCTIVELNTGKHSSTTFLYSHHYGSTPSFTLLNRSAHNDDSVTLLRYYYKGTYDETGIDIWLYATSKVKVFIDDNYQSGGIQIVDFEHNPSISGLTIEEIYFRKYSFAVMNQRHSLFKNRVGIGLSPLTEPAYPLEVTGYKANVGYTAYMNSNGVSTSDGSNHMCIFGDYGIATDYAFYITSDRRIKKNIVDVPDNLALQQVRNIPCRYYEYKDDVKRGPGKTIGFIAQEVKEILPMAVSLERNFIPNEMRSLDNISWEEIIDSSNNGYKLTCDLQDVSGVKYKFYVSNDPSGNGEIIKEVVGNSDNTFIFNKKWNNIFCYGKEVEDFHMVDKQKLFALNFSATQEIDRIQQQEKAKLIETQTQLQTTQTQLQSTQTQLSEAQTKITNLEAALALLTERVSALETQ